MKCSNGAFLEAKKIHEKTQFINW